MEPNSFFRLTKHNSNLCKVVQFVRMFHKKGVLKQNRLLKKSEYPKKKEVYVLDKHSSNKFLDLKQQ